MRTNNQRQACRSPVSGLGTLKQAAWWVLPPLTVFFFYYTSSWSSINHERNRYFDMWTHRDIWITLSCVVFLASCWLLVECILHMTRKELGRRLSYFLFSIIALEILFHNIDYSISYLYSETNYLWGINALRLFCLMAVFLSIFLGKARLYRGIRSICLYLSPAMVCVVVSAFMSSEYPQRMDPLVTARPAALTADPAIESDAVPIYIFIFDEWSYDRTFRSNGEVRTAFPNLAEVCEGAVVYTNARAPGEETRISLPRLLFQTERKVFIGDGQVGFRQEGGFVPSDQMHSIFQAVPADHYHTVMVGFCLPYDAWLGDNVDVCRSYNFTVDTQAPLVDGFQRTFFAMQHSRNVLIRKIFSSKNVDICFRYYASLHEQLRQDVRRILLHSPANTFAVIHYLMPHKPYLFRSDGSIRKPTLDAFGPTEAYYVDHLVCLDRLIERITTMMKERGTYGQALLILTSDHNWRKDPVKEQRCPRDHVPLIIKWPEQQEGKVVERRFKTVQLADLIEKGLQRETRHTIVENSDSCEGIACGD